MRRHTELAGTVHANAPEILLEIENILVRAMIAIRIQRFCLVKYHIIIYSYRMMTFRWLSLANPNARGKSLKYATQCSERR